MCLNCKKMGADISVEGNTAFINGVSHLTAADIEATDLRAGAAMIIAAQNGARRFPHHRNPPY